jgi:hypothetical protein
MGNIPDPIERLRRRAPSAPLKEGTLLLKTMMSGRRRVRTALRGVLYTLAATAIAVLTLQSPSMADESWFGNCSSASVSCQTGVAVSGPQGECVTSSDLRHSTVACVVYDGDYVYVKDGQADGHSAVAGVWSGSNSTLRYCRNTLGAGKWARCDFDWPETGSHYVEAGYLQSSSGMNTGKLWDWSNK